MHENAIHAVADLPGVAKRALHAVSNSAAQIGIGKNDQRRLPTQFQIEFLQRRRGLSINVDPGLGGAGKGDYLGQRAADQGVADFIAGTRYGVQHALR